MKKFNPKLSVFMKRNPDQKVLSFAWSMYWRLMLVICAIELVLYLLILVWIFLTIAIS